ncbi:MAG: efflux RND transporter permease subunit [Patescibacteria group bacterium]|nr:efflux RND transporter permease subunit [Patescibacteria group bacterium]
MEKIDINEKLNKALKKESKSIAGFFIRNYRFTYLIIFFIVIAGAYSISTIEREAEPEIKVPFAVVTTIYPGANPSDIEELITDKIETEIKNLDDLKIYTSESGSGVSSIFVEFQAEADLDDSFDKLREATDKAEPNLPGEAETPIVTEINFNDFPIVTYSLTGNYNEVELKSFADVLQNEFESINDVSKAIIIGGLTREFQIIANKGQLANYNISLNKIVSAISLSNFSLPAGDIEIDDYKYSVRVIGRFKNINDLNDIVVATVNNTPIYLRDLAKIKDDFKEKTSESKIGFPGELSCNTISLQVYKATGGNILNIVDDSNAKINELKKNNTLPENLIIQKTNDSSVFIKDNLYTLGSSAVITVILINLILMLILSFRGAVITAMSVPLAFLMAFTFLYLEGLTLNSMVLFSLVLSLGLMVDNAIVIIEGINEYVSKHKKTMLEAALLSVWNFKWAITSGTMTTVAAFLPMLLVSGILGEYLSIMPQTVSVMLLSSLAIALVVIPTLATRFIKIKSNGSHNHRNKKRHQYISGFTKKLQNKYQVFMHDILPNKKKRRTIIASAWILLVIAVIIPASGLMKIEMFPKIDLDYFLLNIELPVGATLNQSRPITREVEKIVASIPELDNYVSNIGNSAVLGFGDSGSSGTHLANLTINLIDKGERERKSYEIADDLRSKLKNISGAKITVNELSAGPPSGSPIEIRIFGNDLKNIDTTTKNIMSYLQEVDGTVNVRNTLKEAAGEFTFSINKQKADFYGLNNTSIASALRQALYGISATEINLDGEDVDVTVRLDSDSFTKVEDLEEIILATKQGEKITLKEVANVKIEPALLSINHRDGQKVALVEADTTQEADLQKILADLDAHTAQMNLPKDVSIQVGGEVEDIEQSFRELFMSMGLAIIFIAFILVLQFNSFKQPFIIIFSVPLAFIGVIAGLNILQMPFSFTTFIGIVSLTGIVVNDAIVLIDRINKNIKDGLEFYEAIIEGGIARMQPIFLTTITTITGVFPLIFASELWRGLSVSMIFGLMTSTVLVLVVIPLIYAGLCFKKCVEK